MTKQKENFLHVIRYYWPLIVVFGGALLGGLAIISRMNVSIIAKGEAKEVVGPVIIDLDKLETKHDRDMDKIDQRFERVQTALEGKIDAGFNNLNTRLDRINRRDGR